MLAKSETTWKEKLIMIDPNYRNTLDFAIFCNFQKKFLDGLLHFSAMHPKKKEMHCDQASGLPLSSAKLGFDHVHQQFAVKYSCSR